MIIECSSSDDIESGHISLNYFTAVGFTFLLAPDHRAVSWRFRRGICCFILASNGDPRPPSPFLAKPGEERGPLLPAVPMYIQVLESSSKCVFSLVRFHIRWVCHRFLLPCVFGVCTFPTENRRKTAFRSTSLQTCHRPSSSLCDLGAASTGGRERAGPGGPAVFTGAAR